MNSELHLNFSKTMKFYDIQNNSLLQQPLDPWQDLPANETAETNPGRGSFPILGSFPIFTAKICWKFLDLKLQQYLVYLVQKGSHLKSKLNKDCGKSLLLRCLN